MNRSGTHGSGAWLASMAAKAAKSTLMESLRTDDLRPYLGVVAELLQSTTATLDCPAMLYRVTGGKTNVLPFGKNPFTFGRSRQCTVSSQIHRGISRVHFMVECKNGGFWLLDKSTNGTFVQGKRAGTCELKSGDVIVVRNFVFVFIGE